MKVAILGAAGGMGSLFTGYFCRQGHEVTGYDKRRPKVVPAGFSISRSGSDAVRGADVVLVAVPIEMTVRVVLEVSRSLKPGSTLVEITSVKGEALPELSRVCRSLRVALLSIHPMFGPTSKSKTFKMIVVGGRRDKAAARLLFPTADISLLGAREHDRRMAYTLSLVHMLNLAFASAVAKGVGVEEFRRTASPLASAQLGISQAVLSQDPRLLSPIQAENPFVGEALSSFISQLEGLRGLAGRKDKGSLGKRFSSTAAKFKREDLDAALGRVYSGAS